MGIYRSGLLHAIIGGCALAATIEVRDGFAVDLPAVFLGFHGAVVLGVLAYAISRFRKGEIGRRGAIGTVALLVCCYALASTGSRNAFFPIAIAAFLSAIAVRRAGETGQDSAPTS